MKSIKPKNIILIISLISLALATAFYVYLDTSFNKLKLEVEDLYKQTAESKATYAELANVKENLKTTLGTEDRLTSLFVSEAYIVDFIQVLETVMRTAEVNGAVESVTEGGDTDLAKMHKKKLHLVLSVSGSFNEILKFQGLLEKLPYKVIIDSAVMRYTPTEKGQSVWHETVNMTAFVTTLESTSLAPVTSVNE